MMKPCWFSGVGCEISDGQAVTCGLKDSFKSVVYRHNSEPLWNELVHIILDPESYPTSHLRFTFRHRSRHSYPKPIAMSFLKLVSDVDDTAIKGKLRLFSSMGFQSKLYQLYMSSEHCYLNSTLDCFNGQRANFILKPPKVIESRTYLY